MDWKRRAASCLLAAAMTASLLPGTAMATAVGQGVLGGTSTPTAVTDTRYNTVKDINPKDTDYGTTNADQVQGDTRWRQQDSTRIMYEYYNGVLIIHGYGSVVGDADAIAISEQTPGTIGGNVLNAHRKSWLDGFYPYLYNGKTNGPERQRTVRKQTTDAAGNVTVTETKETVELYETHTPIKATDIQYIVIDDKMTATSGNMGLSHDDVHDSYDMFEDQYASGITEIAPYAFARLPNLVAIDFDASQIKSIGEYAFAGCEKLGTGSVYGKQWTITYSKANVMDPTTKTMGKNRTVYTHDYKPGGCSDACKGDTDQCKHTGPELPCYEEKAGRVILPHNVQTIGEHAFQNCPAIKEFVVHEDNPYFVASCLDAAAWNAYAGSYDLYTNGVIYSDNEASKDGIKQTGYTRLRSAVSSDYANVPDQYKNFWRGPFDETEPMTLEWYVRSWKPKEYIKKVLEVTADPFGADDHCSWTAIEEAVDKAKAAIGHTGTGSEVVVGTGGTANDAWKTTWVSYLDHSKYYDENWWNDDYFDNASNNIGYNRAEFGCSIAGQTKTTFDNYVKDNGAMNRFQTLFLHPEGHPDGTFQIFPGHDPTDWSNAVATGNKDNNLKVPTTVVAPFAFANSVSMSTIDMTVCDSLTTFGQGTFLNCQALTQVIFPEAGYTSGGSPHPSDAGRKPNYQLVRLADDMFSQCRALNSLTNLDRDHGPTLGLSDAEYMDHHVKPDNTAIHYSTVQELGQNCFHKCLNLTQASFGGALPDSLLIIGQSAFHTCKKLTEITIHKNIEIIGDYAFSDCYNLSDVKFEEKEDPPANGGPVKDRIKDHRNGTNENKARQFYISGEFSSANVPMAVQFGNKTFEHCTALKTLHVGSYWLIQKTTFENAIYITEINYQTSKGPRPIKRYDFKNGATGQGTDSPDRAGKLNGNVAECFKDCAYHKGLHDTGTIWEKNP